MCLAWHTDAVMMSPLRNHCHWLLLWKHIVKISRAARKTKVIRRREEENNDMNLIPSLMSVHMMSIVFARCTHTRARAVIFIARTKIWCQRTESSRNDRKSVNRKRQHGKLNLKKIFIDNEFNFQPQNWRAHTVCCRIRFGACSAAARIIFNLPSAAWLLIEVLTV